MPTGAPTGAPAGATSVLVVGGSGFLGGELIRRAADSGWATAATYATRPGVAAGAAATVDWHRLDLRDADEVDTVLAAVQPDVVINTSSGGADWAVTAEGPVRLAVAAARHRIRLVHLSSDAVFSGRASPYDESCPLDPVTPYGAAKAAAETGILVVHPAAAVVRTSLIIGHGRSEHERLVHDLAAGTRAGALYTDDIRCPVHVTDLAEALLELAASDAAGVHHLAGPDALSRYELGTLIARRDGLAAARLPSALRAHSPLPGALDVRLDSTATLRTLRSTLRGAREFLNGPGPSPG
ncbi:SDR family oxidoreductase [Streptomyces sp. NPDC090025]|uniref:SDR family oxidoreductase n=1 Tax=Streptomyces sp. NPDC090025 TaxID=3365922 RepID=UPI0038330A7A